jgi:hypothetical protein
MKWIFKKLKIGLAYKVIAFQSETMIELVTQTSARPQAKRKGWLARRKTWYKDPPAQEGLS